MVQTIFGLRNVNICCTSNVRVTKEEREEMVKFLWGKRGGVEGDDAGAEPGRDVRGRRVPAAAAFAASKTTSHHPDITIKAQHDLLSR
ncbi:unnamed protein product [Leptosia nina]|uniref:Uncharacterized protein n=1 Tax=Leptosia nina TaxID=320188 RepID=A0AAV1JXH9_9NEOP